MRNYLLILALLFCTQCAFAAATPLTAPYYEKPQPGGFKAWWQDKKFKLKAIKVWYSHHRVANGEPTEKQKRKAVWSMGLGIGSLALFVIPLGVLLALPAAVLAIIFGAQSLKGNNNAMGIVGIVTGGISVLIFLLVLIFIALIIVTF